MSATRITGNFILTGDQVNDLTDEGESTLHYHASDRARDNHIGTQLADTISDFIAAVEASDAFMDSDFPEQSFHNLIKNGDFESWSAGAAASPDGWGKVGAGSTIARSATNKIGGYSAALTRVDNVCYLNRNITSLGTYYQGRTFTFGCWVKDSNANNSQLLMYDGVGDTLSPFHTGSGDWEFITTTKTFNAAASEFNIKLYNKNNNSTVLFDGAMLVEGSVCPAFSPKPLIDDGKTLEIESDTNTVKIGGKLVMTCTPQVLTGAGAISVETCITHLVTGGVGADAVTLADGMEGQEKIILIKTLTTGGDTSVVTPAHFAHGTTFTGNQAGSIQNLIFTNGSWHWTGGRNTVIA